jgi:hypothetical protein
MRVSEVRSTLKLRTAESADRQPVACERETPAPASAGCRVSSTRVGQSVRVEKARTRIPAGSESTATNG